METVLEKCGITNQLISNLKRKGLFVPKKMKVTKKVLKSPSEFWIYYVGDKFTPPLSKKERLDYITSPKNFYRDLLNGTKLFVEVNRNLYRTFEVAKVRLAKEELIAALLAIQRIWHASIDYNYFKYDRHLEYDKYKESPVGYYWLRLRKLCLLAAKNLQSEDKELWAKEKMLNLLAGYGVIKKSNKMNKGSKEAYNEIRNNLKSTNQIRELHKLVEGLKIFSRAQEDEAKIFNSKIANHKISSVDFILCLWDYLIGYLKKNPKLMRPRNIRFVMNLGKAQDLPSKAIAIRKLSHKGEIFFAPKIIRLYSDELKRWL